MAKWVRLWGKKRGERMSGWWVVGSVGEAAFFGVLFLLGIVSLTIVVSWQVFWPASNIIRPGSGFWLMLIASISFAVIGLTAFILQVSQTLASPERRSAIASKVKNDHRRRSDSSTEHANLPNLDELTDSPGVKLAFRLAGQRGENNQLILSALFATAWNSMVAVLIVVVLFQFSAPNGPNYFLTILLIPFLAVSVIATRWFFRLFRVRTGIGPTAVELNALPMLPGYEYQLYVCQYGRVEFSDFRVSLVAFEETTFQQGTDVRTEVVEVSRLEAKIQAQEASKEEGAMDADAESHDLDKQSTSGTPLDVPQAAVGKKGQAALNLRAEPEKPLELDCVLSLPPDMMHSFHSEHSALVWRIVIQGESTRWPAFCRSFPVAVFPRSAV